jgi:DNA-binding transcriptional MerR regulator
MNEVNIPYTVKEVSKLMGLSARMIAKLYENEKGVLIYERANPRRKRASYRTIRIPRHV